MPKRKVLSRREFLGFSVLAAGAAALAACSSASTPSPTSAPAKAAAPTKAPAAAPTTAPAAPAATSPAAAPTTAPASSSAEWDKVVAAAKQEGKVLMYGSIMGSGDATKLAAVFKRDTGLDFEFITVLAGPATTRIREETKAGKGPDIFEASGGAVGVMAPQGTFVPLKGKPLPVWQEPQSVWFIQPGYKSQDWEYVLSRFRPREGHIMVNTKLLSPADYPKDWHDLATNPKYKSKIVFLDPEATTAASIMWENYGYVAKELTPKDFWGLFKGQDTLLFSQSRANRASVAQGERALTLNPADETVLDLMTAGAPVKNLFFPDLPYQCFTADMAVLKTAQHPNAALVFANWFLSKEGQDAIGKLQQVASIRRDVPDYTPSVLKGEVIGGGKRGPLFVETALQTKFGADLKASGVLKKLTDGSSADDYDKAYNAFVKEWESKNGGSQDKLMTLQK